MSISEYKHRVVKLMVEILKALGDENRLRIVNLLTEGPLCVCEIEEAIGISQSNASRHLNRLRTAGVISSERKSQWIYYGLDNEFMAQYGGLLKEITQHLNCNMYKEDKERLVKVKKPSEC